VIEAYLVHVIIIACIYSVLAIGLDLAMGFGGMLNVGHAAFFGIGAYASAIIVLSLGTPFWVGLAVGALFAAFCGFLLSFTSLKLKGDYLALTTLGFAFLVGAVLKNWTEVTRGPMGIAGIPAPEVFGFSLSTPQAFFPLAVAAVVAAFVVARRITRSPFGRVLRAVRDDEVAAASLGKNVFRVKAVAFAASALFAGAAGSLFAHYTTFIDPSTFDVFATLLVLSMLVVGGLASARGALIGAFVLTVLSEALRFLPLPADSIGALRLMIYAVALVAIIIFRPQGITGEYLLGKGVKNAAA